MISFFPSPYPDELWYSVICRYYVHSGNSCAKHTMRQLYATKIETALLSLYGNYIPTADISAKQLHATLCSKSVAPRYILQLAVLLELSLHDLLHAPDAVPDFKSEMKALYQSGASMYHIAQLYGIDSKTVARWVK